MDNTFGAVWEASKLPEPPLDIRLTNSVGEKVGALHACPYSCSAQDVLVCMWSEALLAHHRMQTYMIIAGQHCL
jgi:hypothetical protein